MLAKLYFAVGKGILEEEVLLFISIILSGLTMLLLVAIAQRKTDVDVETEGLRHFELNTLSL